MMYIRQGNLVTRLEKAPRSRVMKHTVKQYIIVSRFLCAYPLDTALRDKWVNR